MLKPAGAARATDKNVGIDFPHIRELYEKDKLDCDIEITPDVFSEHRRLNWPSPVFGSAYDTLTDIYNSVRSWCPN